MNEVNRYGLYDHPQRIGEKELATMTRQEFEQKLDEGAFLMGREEAIRLGYIHPDYEPDTIMVGFVEGA